MDEVRTTPERTEPIGMLVTSNCRNNLICDRSVFTQDLPEHQWRHCVYEFQ